MRRGGSLRVPSLSLLQGPPQAGECGRKGDASSLTMTPTLSQVVPPWRAALPLKKGSGHRQVLHPHISHLGPSGVGWKYSSPWEAQKSIRHWMDNWGCQGIIQDGPGGHVPSPTLALPSPPACGPHHASPCHLLSVHITRLSVWKSPERLKSRDGSNLSKYTQQIWDQIVRGLNPWNEMGYGFLFYVSLRNVALPPISPYVPNPPRQE